MAMEMKSELQVEDVDEDEASEETSPDLVTHKNTDRRACTLHFALLVLGLGFCGFVAEIFPFFICHFNGCAH